MAIAAACITTAIVDAALSSLHCTPLALVAPERGAVASFLGVVRDHVGGRGVLRLKYECYRPMAEKVLARLARDAGERFDVAVIAAHGLGAMAPGEVALALHASSTHRAAACEALRWLLEAIKRDLPVWKREWYSDGTAAWVHGS